MSKHELCACGKPLHYQNARTEAFVRMVIRRQGEDVLVTIPGGQSWWVPRHFIALHGISTDTLPAVAKRYGFRLGVPD